MLLFMCLELPGFFRNCLREANDLRGGIGGNYAFPAGTALFLHPTIRKWHIFFGNRKCDMSNLWGKDILLVANGIISATHRDLVFKFFIFSKIQAFTVCNFYYPSPETEKKDSRKMIRNIANKIYLYS